MKTKFTFLIMLLFAVSATAQKFHSVEGEFKIAFKAQPVVSSQDIPTEIGTIKMTLFMHELNVNEAYMASYNDYPEDLIAQADPYVLLESAKNGAVQNIGASIYEEKQITVQGYPAYDFKGKGAGDLYVVARIVLVDNRLYQAMYLKQGTGLVEGIKFAKSLEITTNQQQAQQVKFNTPANIELISPRQERGFAVVLNQNTKVKVKASDPEGIDGVYINGVEAFENQQGYFTLSANLKQHKSIVVEVVDLDGGESEKEYPLQTNLSSSTTNKKLATQEKRLALLIGNSNYTHGGDLRNPVNDIRSMQKALKVLGFDVMVFENCSQRDMKKAMDDFGQKLGSYQVGLFFYAGHGIQVDGNNYLVPVDAQLKNKNDVDYDCVSTGRLMGKMEGSGNKTNIIILDACRDNPFERSWSRTAKGSGLAFMNAPSGTLIAYATSPGKTASDGAEGNNGLYTSALLKHINTPDITVLQLFQRVRKDVMQKSNNEQTPWESTSLSGDFYFIK